MRPKELQVVDVPVINRHMCEQWHRQKGINVIIHQEMMCAGYINGGKDSCQVRGPVPHCIVSYCIVYRNIVLYLRIQTSTCFAYLS